MKSRLDRVEALRTEDEAKKSTEKKRTEENRREKKSRTRPPSLLMPQGMLTWLLKGQPPGAKVVQTTEWKLHHD